MRTASITALALWVGACGSPVLDLGQSRHDGGAPVVRDAGGETLDGGANPRDAGRLDGPKPDLVVAALSAPPATHVPGEALSVTVDVENRGERSAPETVVEVRLERIDGSSRGVRFFQIGLISFGAIARGDRETRTRILPAPPSLETARYRLVVEVDPDERIDESDESNNLLDGPVFTVSHVVVTPTLDFGTVGLGCTAELSARVENRGTTRVVVAPSVLDPAGDVAFQLDAPTSPRALSPGNGFDITLTFAPDAIDAFTSQLFLRHSQLAGDTPLPIRGMGDIEPLREERFAQRAAPLVDFLFVVDDSPDMTALRDRLVAAAGPLFEHLAASGVDYHVAITTTDVSVDGPRGAFVGDPKVITPATPNGARVFETSVVETEAKVPSSGGLAASRLALSPENLDGVNVGFLREDASLAVIYVSNEDDTSGDDVANFIADFRALKAPDGEQRFVAHAIVGPPNGCVVEGARYANVARTTGGFVDAICVSDWTGIVTQYPGAGFGFAVRFDLSRAPVPGTVEVEVDGTTLPSNAWRFVPNPPAVVFEGSAVPEPGVEVVVKYRTPC
ncbi:MAG: CARDB domain-containing protein [Deltaproteobacteria bacterium]|jgi:hypothetical protein